MILRRPITCLLLRLVYTGSQRDICGIEFIFVGRLDGERSPWAIPWSFAIFCFSCSEALIEHSTPLWSLCSGFRRDTRCCFWTHMYTRKGLVELHLSHRALLCFANFLAFLFRAKVDGCHLTNSQLHLSGFFFCYWVSAAQSDFLQFLLLCKCASASASSRHAAVWRCRCVCQESPCCLHLRRCVLSRIPLVPFPCLRPRREFFNYDLILHINSTFRLSKGIEYQTMISNFQNVSCNLNMSFLNKISVLHRSFPSTSLLCAKRDQDLLTTFLKIRFKVTKPVYCFDNCFALTVAFCCICSA